MMNVEAILTQLVFEHSLRIRLSVPTEQKKPEQSLTSTVKVSPTAQALPETALETEENAVDTALITESLASESTQTPVEGAEAGETAGPSSEEVRDSLIGTMTNLITTDLGVIKTPTGHILDIRRLFRSFRS